MLYYVRVNHGVVIEMYIKYLFDICRYGGSLICDCAFLAYILEMKVNNVIYLRIVFSITDATEFLSPLNFV